MNSPEIRVSLTVREPNEPELIGQEYSAIVMDYSSEHKTWYNTGIVCRADSPGAAFEQAYKQYEKQK